MGLDVEVRGFTPEHGCSLYDVDEVVAQGGVFHLETMSDDCVWFGLYERGTGRRVSCNVGIENGKLVVRVQDDERTADERAKDVNLPPGGTWADWDI